MPPTTNNDSPKLAPPGAGLPKPELLIANLRFHWLRKRTTRAQATATFARRRDEILAIARGCDPEKCARRVLIRRLRGLEDSSRHWSVFMTLDHLRIVNDSIAAGIGFLAAGQAPPRPASTAAVKPSPDAAASSIQAFADSCANLERVVAGVPDLATKVKFAHPWFGPLDAASWHVLAGFHMDIHRKQIESILAGLAAA